MSDYTRYKYVQQHIDSG